MDSALLAALITALVSLVLAIGKIVWDWRTKVSDRKLAAKEKLDRYRVPLLSAVDELGRRLNNIRHDHFLVYLDIDERRDTALLSTHFRLAQYLGWTEIIYGYSQHLQFEADQATVEVSRALGEVARLLASDSFDRLDPDDFSTTQFLLWREEQRAIGELMRDPGGESRCIGFHTFATTYDERFARWFARFENDLCHGPAPRSERFDRLHRAAADLLEKLDVDGLLVERDSSGTLVNPSWARPDRLSSLPDPTAT